MTPAPSRPIVAIDGPAGAGKSTVARMLARRLGYAYIDSGAMYRAVALFALRRSVPLDDAERLAELARELRFEFLPGRGDRPRVLVNGEDVSAAIRTPEIDTASSRVSQWRGVRSALVAEQQRMGAEGGVVMEGRDIGTVVFPQARAKIYLVASPEERARRRAKELAARGQRVDLAQVLGEVVERDRRDMEREHSPLFRAKDATEFLTDGLTIEQVVDGLEALVREREGG
jgi:cytidylate kinase